MCEKQRDKESNYPDQCGSVGWALPHETKLTSWSQARAQAWVVGLVPSWGACERQLSDVSLTRGCFSLFLPPSPPSEDKWIKS